MWVLLCYEDVSGTASGWSRNRTRFLFERRIVLCVHVVQRGERFVFHGTQLRQVETMSRRRST
jgi:hypothetical protein